MRTSVLAAVAVLVCLSSSSAEPGFEALFNGKNLDGWRFVFREKGVDGTKTFQAVDGVLVCSGRPAGYMVTKGSFERFTLRFDWRYKRPDGLADDAKFRGNSGYLLFVQEDTVWPRSLEVQGMNRDAAGIIPIKCKAKFTTDAEARTKARKPVGEWNSMEIIAKGGTVTAFLNGAKISTVTECDLSKGPIGFQSEGAEIHWRNIRIRKEP